MRLVVMIKPLHYPLIIVSYCAVSIRGILVEIFHFSLRVPASIKATRGILCVLGVGMGNTVLEFTDGIGCDNCNLYFWRKQVQGTTKPYRLKYIKYAFPSV